MNSAIDWDDDAPVVHAEEANEGIEGDEDWGKFHGSKLVPRGIEAGSGLSYEDMRTSWLRDCKAEYEEKLKAVPDGPAGYQPCKVAWNGNQLHPDDVIAVFKSLLGNDLDEVMSKASSPFGCTGVYRDAAGNISKNAAMSGGGCVLFIRRRRHVSLGKRVRYVFAPEGEGVALKMVADLWPAPLAGVLGSRMGELIGDSYMKVFDSRRRNYEFTVEINKALKMPELRVEVRSQYVQGQWALVVWTEGSGSARAAANRKLRNGVMVLFEGMNRSMKIAAGGESNYKVKRVQQESKKSSMFEEINDTKGRRIKAYKLKAEAVDDAELQVKITEQLEVFGQVQSSKIRPSKDGCSWLLAVYAEADSAVAACDDDAIAEALTAEGLADPDQGFVRCELCDAERDIEYLERKSVATVKKKGGVVTYLQAANGAADVDAMLAGLLRSEKTTKELLQQVVNPTVAGVKIELAATGRKVVTAVNKALKSEVKSLKKDMKDMKTLLQNVLAGVNDEVPKAKRKKDAGSSKRGRSMTPARVKTPTSLSQGVPVSAMKVRRSAAKAENSSLGADAEGAAATRLIKTLYARPEGAAVIAQLANARDQAVLLRKFKSDAYQDDEDDDEEDDEEDDDDDMEGEGEDMYDDEESEDEF